MSHDAPGRQGRVRGRKLLPLLVGSKAVILANTPSGRASRSAGAWRSGGFPCWARRVRRERGRGRRDERSSRTPSAFIAQLRSRPRAVGRPLVSAPDSTIAASARHRGSRAPPERSGRAVRRRGERGWPPDCQRKRLPVAGTPNRTAAGGRPARWRGRRRSEVGSRARKAASPRPRSPRGAAQADGTADVGQSNVRDGRTAPSPTTCVAARAASLQNLGGRRSSGRSTRRRRLDGPNGGAARSLSSAPARRSEPSPARAAWVGVDDFHAKLLRRAHASADLTLAGVRRSSRCGRS